MSATESVKRACGKRPSSVDVKKSGKEGATAPGEGQAAANERNTCFTHLRHQRMTWS
jgi:hypothetical protein